MATASALLSIPVDTSDSAIFAWSDAAHHRGRSGERMVTRRCVAIIAPKRRKAK